MDHTNAQNDSFRCFDDFNFGNPASLMHGLTECLPGIFDLPGVPLKLDVASSAHLLMCPHDGMRIECSTKLVELPEEENASLICPW